MTSDEVILGFGLTVILAAACQIAASRLRLPAIVLLLPVGFLAGHFISAVNPQESLGAAFSPWSAWASRSSCSTAAWT